MPPATLQSATHAPRLPPLLGPDNFADWMAWAAVVIPLVAFAISALLYVLNRRAECFNDESKRVQELITIANNAQANQGLAVMLIAISELKRYRRYREAIVRAVRALQAPHRHNSPNSPIIAAEEDLIDHLRRPTVLWGRSIN